jgi:anti-sigma B factor antagonist
MSAFHVHVEPPRNGGARLRLCGECDLATAPELRRTLAEVLDGGSVADVTLDVQNLTFVDSTGLNVMVHANNRLKEFGGAVTVLNPHGAVLKVLEVTGLDKVFAVAYEASSQVDHNEPEARRLA